MSYNTLVMSNPAYAAGALVLAESLRQTNAQFPLYLMVADVELPECVLRHFNVVQVPLLEFKTKPLKTEKQRSYYPWISKSYTKMQFLNPEYIPTAKTMHLDADSMFVKNADDLIQSEKQTWGCFASSWCRLPEYNHGEIIKPEHLRRGLANMAVCMGCMLVDTPNEEKYKALNSALTFNPEGFGYQKCCSGSDEQLWALTQLDTNTPVHHIDIGYTMPVGKEKQMKPKSEIHAFQWYHTKPWNVDPVGAKYDDIRAWWSVADSLASRDPEAGEFLKRFIVPGQTY